MTDPRKPAEPAAGAVGHDARAARLKAALKANIARRKQQARARDEGGDSAEPQAAGTGHEG